MISKFRTSLFLFRRDLRLEDNTGLLFALKNSEKVIPGFILTPEQVVKNPFSSEHCLRFMFESLIDLDGRLKEKTGRLYLFKGKSDVIVSRCIEALNIDAVIVNRDYTPYSRKRDKQLETLCKKKGIAFHSLDDALLHPPEDTLKQDGKPYTVFTPYFRNAIRQSVASPQRNSHTHYFRGKIAFAQEIGILSQMISKQTVQNGLKGGRQEALKLLKNISKLGAYAKQRDFPFANETSHLSPYLKFTILSPREVYAAIEDRWGAHHELARSLYWRDFFTSIAFFFPHVFQGAFRTQFDRISWSYNKKAFHRWTQGMTGFPIVDAGMREMQATGFMHNRVRMIAASFLVKDLHIDWRWGEKHFAKSLIDYDPSVNNGNWQWVAGTGADAQPYFRIFNPWTQQKKFDPECKYIKQWVLELQDIPEKGIHEWHKKENHSLSVEYPPPMVDHGKEATKALRLYRSV